MKHYFALKLNETLNDIIVPFDSLTFFFSCSYIANETRFALNIILLAAVRFLFIKQFYNIPV